MKKILVITFLISGCAALAQQVPLFSQYLNNDFLLNPAVCGTKSYAPASVSARLQWAGFSGAPSTQIASIHGAQGPTVGLGLALMNHTTGATSMTSAQFAYALRFRLTGKMKISFGLAPMMIQHSISKSKLTLEDANDNTFNRLSGKTMIADVNAGIYVYSNKWAASLSVPQLLENKYRLGDDLFTERLRRHYLVFGSYDFTCREKYVITPSALIKAMEGGAPVQFDLNVRATYNKLFWAGLSYRAASSQSFNEAAVVSVGVLKYNFAFGYAFDYSFASIRSYSAGSHEIFLTYRIRCKSCDKVEEAPESAAKENQ
jgi:type IX secretion system PorP/SprF family membrane protein